ncbi:hypothetical protein DL96DRAFT_1627831 [Flagelloscypha sp. PMI_526]|nr:hypothetical protein DL96DRAFT_1627831 [Flagelloscypha sp. PMI_526]
MLFTHHVLLFALCLSATLFSLSTANPQLSNAERMRRGLPLNKPVMRHPSRTRRDSVPSGIPPLYTPPFVGYLQVLSLDGKQSYGYLTTSTVVSSTTQAAKVTFTAYGSGLAITCSSCNGLYLGLTGSSSSMSIKTDNKEGPIVPTLVNLSAAPGPNLAKTPSYVWSYDPSTNDVSINWANGDLSSSSNQVLYMSG